MFSHCFFFLYRAKIVIWEEWFCLPSVVLHSPAWLSVSGWNSARRPVTQLHQIELSFIHFFEQQMSNFFFFHWIILMWKIILTERGSDPILRMLGKKTSFSSPLDGSAISAMESDSSMKQPSHSTEGERQAWGSRMGVMVLGTHRKDVFKCKPERFSVRGNSKFRKCGDGESQHLCYNTMVPKKYSADIAVLPVKTHTHFSPACEGAQRCLIAHGSAAKVHSDALSITWHTILLRRERRISVEVSIFFLRVGGSSTEAYRST